LSAVGTLHAMASGDTVELAVDGGPAWRVTYTAEQALGDDNRPAPGFTIGWYVLRGPGGTEKTFRHSPYKPGTWAGQAKVYVAEQVSDAILRGSGR
jgi:hypothetical protein